MECLTLRQDACPAFLANRISTSHHGAIFRKCQKLQQEAWVPQPVSLNHVLRGQGQRTPEALWLRVLKETSRQARVRTTIQEDLSPQVTSPILSFSTIYGGLQSTSLCLGVSRAFDGTRHTSKLLSP